MCKIHELKRGLLEGTSDVRNSLPSSKEALVLETVSFGSKTVTVTYAMGQVVCV